MVLVPARPATQARPAAGQAHRPSTIDRRLSGVVVTARRQLKLPHDFPPWETVYGYIAKRQKDGVFAQLTGVLRRPLRQQEGKPVEPSACVIDAQSVKTSTSVPAAGQGTDAAKKTPHGANSSRHRLRCSNSDRS